MFIHHSPRCGLVFLAAAVACLVHLQSHAGETCPQPRTDSYSRIYGITLNHDGTSVLIEDWSAALLGNVATGKIQQLFYRVVGTLPPQPIQAQFNSDSSKVAVYYDDGGVYLWDTSSGLELARREGNYKDTYDGSVCLPYDDLDLMTRYVESRQAFVSLLNRPGYTGSATVLMLDDESMEASIHGHHLVGIQDFPDDGMRMLSYPNIIDWDSGEVLATLENSSKIAISAEMPRFSLDGSKVIVADEAISVWDGQTGVLIVSGPSPASAPIDTWECHGDVLIAGSSQSLEFFALDAATLEIIHEIEVPDLFPSQDYGMCDVTVSGDGSRFGINFHGVARIYDVDSGEQVSEFIAGRSGVYSPDLQSSACIAPPWALPADAEPAPAGNRKRGAVIRVQRQDGTETRIPVNVNDEHWWGFVVYNLALSADGDTVAYYNDAEKEFHFHDAISGEMNLAVGFTPIDFPIMLTSWFSPDASLFYFNFKSDFSLPAWVIDLNAPELGAVFVEEVKGGNPEGPIEDRPADLQAELLDETTDGKLQLFRSWGWTEAEVCTVREVVEYNQFEVHDTETNTTIKTLKGVFGRATFSEDGQYVMVAGDNAWLFPIFDCDPEANAAAATAAILALPGLDFDSNGKLDESEYAGMQSGSPEEFEALDLNGDGALSLAELLRHIPDGRPIHNADTNGDGKVSIGELLRLVQFYNSGGYDCAADPDDTEDGYLPDGDAKLSSGCPAHAADYLNGDGVIDLTELLRLIQLYNLGGITPCETSEDGFCAVES